ncbi:hypothetical protein Agub_g9929, partial [Astrephomene gubernaculifera]
SLGPHVGYDGLIRHGSSGEGGSAGSAVPVGGGSHMGGGGVGGGGGSCRLLSALLPGAAEQLVGRVCLKLFSCGPEELPPDMLARLRRWAGAAEPDVVQVFMRRGCVHVIANVRLNSSPSGSSSTDSAANTPSALRGGCQALLASRLLGGHSDLRGAVGALTAAFGDSGLLRGRRVVVQAAEGHRGAFELLSSSSRGADEGSRGGLSGGCLAHWVADAEMWAAPAVTAVVPAAVPCGSPSVLLLLGRQLHRPGTRFFARCGTASLELTPLPLQHAPDSATAGAQQQQQQQPLTHTLLHTHSQQQSDPPPPAAIQALRPPRCLSATAAPVSVAGVVSGDTAAPDSPLSGTRASSSSTSGSLSAASPLSSSLSLSRSGQRAALSFTRTHTDPLGSPRGSMDVPVPPHKHAALPTSSAGEGVYPHPPACPPASSPPTPTTSQPCDDCTASPSSCQPHFLLLSSAPSPHSSCPFTPSCGKEDRPAAVSPATGAPLCP